MGQKDQYASPFFHGRTRRNGLQVVYPFILGQRKALLPTFLSLTCRAVSKGRLLCLFDQDDVWEADKLSRAFALAYHCAPQYPGFVLLASPIWF